MERHKNVAIIPAYNEADSIGRVVNGLIERVAVIVVDDGSSDDTARIAEAAGATVIRHQKNYGYDQALASGFEGAASGGYDFFITFDADGQHDAQLIDEYIRLRKKNYGLVLGVRPKTARLAEAVFGLVSYFCCGVRDPLCGMKGYGQEVYEILGYDPSMRSIGTSLALSGVRRGFLWVEVPIPIHEREGQPRFGKVIRANIQILSAMIRFFKNARGERDL